MVVSHSNLLFQGSIFRGYVSFREGTSRYHVGLKFWMILRSLKRCLLGNAPKNTAKPYLFFPSRQSPDFCCVFWDPLVSSQRFCWFRFFDDHVAPETEAGLQRCLENYVLLYNLKNLVFTIITTTITWSHYS